jgi:hypothetical protein
MSPSPRLCSKLNVQAVWSFECSLPVRTTHTDTSRPRSDPAAATGLHAAFFFLAMATEWLLYLHLPIGTKQILGQRTERGTTLKYYLN